MPVYNTELFIGDAINSVINQTYTNWELICVDDGSSDKSPELLTDFSKVDKRIKVIFQEHSGRASVARNRALEFANGVYIAMLDSDDKYENNILESIIEKTNIADSDFIIFNLCFWDYEKNIILSEKKGLNGDTSISISGRDAFKLSLNWQISGCGAIKASIIKKIRYDESDTNGDEYSTRLFLLNSEQISFVNAKYFYRSNNYLSNNISIRSFYILDTLYKLLILVGNTENTNEIENQWVKKYSKSLLRLYADFFQYKNTFNSIELENLSIYLERHYSIAKNVIRKHIEVNKLLFYRSIKYKIFFILIVKLILFRRKLIKSRMSLKCQTK